MKEIKKFKDINLLNLTKEEKLEVMTGPVHREDYKELLNDYNELMEKYMDLLLKEEK